MSVDNRDFLDEAVTTDLQLFGFGVPADPSLDLSAPAFLAMGTQITRADGTELAEPEAPEAYEEESTQPIPRMTMAELVFAHEPLARGSMGSMGSMGAMGAMPGPRPMRRGSELEVKAREPRALGTVPPLTHPVGPLSLAALQVSNATPSDRSVLPGMVDQVEMPSSVPATSRKIRPRRTRPRARTIAARRLTSIELREVANVREEQAERPRTRAECSNEQRPCPWVSCKHHLYLDVNPRTGSIKINFPDLEPWELKQTCALDVADHGGHTLEEVGDITNLTRERIRQLELRGLIELRGRSRSLR